jgi:hypothetical protein
VSQPSRIEKLQFHGLRGLGGIADITLNCLGDLNLLLELLNLGIQRLDGLEPLGDVFRMVYLCNRIGNNCNRVLGVCLGRKSERNNGDEDEEFDFHIIWILEPGCIRWWGR